ncbi:MAG: Cupin 2 conserved barrel domain protein [Edaphobacter sp.]|nr:Cupin 2 conserved barrel domain protein [Edaphobacter sp.]
MKTNSTNVEETGKEASTKSAVFNLNTIAKNFPATSDTMLVDTRLTDEEKASARVFRVYTPVPAHYHTTCDEYLTVLSGRATWFFGDEPPFEVGPGQLIFFKQSTVHGTAEILEEPFVVLAVDTPRRPPSDITFVNPSDGTAETFIQSKVLY